MPITVPSSSTTAFASVSTLTLTKPAGTVDGDLMIAVIGHVDDVATVVFTTVPAGWTEAASSTHAVGGFFLSTHVYYKRASSEGASWNWVANGTYYLSGGVLRVAGSAETFTVDDANDTNDSSPEFGAGITAIAGSLLIMTTAASDVGASCAASGYAIANGNPTWTELLDFFDAGVVAKNFSCAYAVRSGSGATGDWTLNYSVGANMESHSQLIGFEPRDDITVSPAVIPAILTVQAPVVSGAANLSTSVINLTATVQNPTVTTAASKWKNPSKNNSAWINENKS